MRLIVRSFRCVCALGLATLAARSQTGLGDASLEQLLNVEVTSVSKKEQKLSQTAAAVFVIGQEDIRRSGSVLLPDLLRMVPGVQVAQIDANAWAITIRGFNSRYSNKVLVLVDGRSVYTPSFSGVYWDQLDTPLEDIERIEVIRGPGATMWGANAVNGVINIITKSSKSTQGGLASATVGADSDARGLLRYGGRLGPASGDGATYRVFGKYTRVGSGVLENGSDGADGWSRVHGGFRTDWSLSPSDTFHAEGDLFSNRESQTRQPSFLAGPVEAGFKQDIRAAGGSLSSAWSHTSADGAQTSVNAYFDTYRRDDMGLPEFQRTFDLSAQQHLVAGQRHDIVFGLGYRAVLSGIPPGYPISLTPPKRTDSLYSAFLQDEIRLGDNLWLTLGSKLEHNAFTGFEYEPSARLAWAPSPRHTLWAAASRAIRQPSRQEAGVNLDLGDVPLDASTTLAVRLHGSPTYRSEELRDFETGYRSQLTKRVSLDLTTFLSFYRHLTTIEPQTPVIYPGPAGIVIETPLVYANLGHSTNYGGELALNWSVNSRWRLSPAWTAIHVNMGLDAGSGDQLSVPLSGNTPRNSFQVRSLLNLTRKLTWDQTLWWNQRIPNGNVAGHVRLDSILSWKVGEHTEFSLVGQNLVGPPVLEFGDSSWIEGTREGRSIYGKITWKF
jgi:iron complex outermembrane receptor protein